MEIEEAKLDRPKKPFHHHVRDMVLTKKNKSPKAFYISLAVIFLALIMFVVSFLVIQSNAALAANIYKPKSIEYLDTFYNQLTIKSDSYREKIEILKKIDKPELEGVFFGWLNYKYAQSGVLSSEITDQTNTIITALDSNSEFYRLIDDYAALKDDLIVFGSKYRAAAPTDKPNILNEIKSRYQFYRTLVENYNLTSDTRSSKAVLIELSSVIADAFANMANYYQQNNRLVFASSSYVYMKTNDEINSEIIKINSYQQLLENQTNSIIERFKQFVDEVKK